MSDHTTALVPLESWAYLSPEQRKRGHLVDIGLFAESLIYYHQILVNAGNEAGFAALVRWFVERCRFDDLVALIGDGTICVYHYAFITAPVEKDGVYILMNIQDEEAPKANTFDARVIGFKELRDLLTDARLDRLRRALEGRVIEVKASSFSRAIEEARAGQLGRAAL